MSLSQRMSLIKESPTIAVMTLAQKLKREGSDVIILAAGEPDFDTPEHIKKAAITAIIDGKTKYTAAGGTIELKQAIVAKFRRDNNLEYTTSEVIVSAGGKHSIYNLLQALIGEGDEVIIPAPYWVSYPDMVLLADGKPVIVDCTIATNYKITPNALKQALNNKTKAIILNSPSNPTGMVYTAQELRALADILISYPQVYIITDDIYEHILFGDAKFVNIANVAPELLNRIVIINGVSKAYAMTGWRIGYAASKDSKLIKAMETIQSQSTSNPCSIAQAAATEALNGDFSSILMMKESFQKRHEYVVTRLNKIKGIKCLPAQGAFYSFFDCSEAINNLYTAGKINQKNDLAFSNYLLNNYLVAGVPGSAFGLDNHMRISYATNMQELETALNRIEHALC
ncbi:MAG: pyridoxal phosphate-dependent aminotransferase [Burkholderiales bacterium]|nr:pyridoxal phosphate-dependent aminotransferase [Burkholderiales bacterium]